MAPTQHIKTAVFPMARIGAAFMPASNFVPQELFPLVDRSILQRSVEEARSAGCERFVFITPSGRAPIEAHFDRSVRLETALQEAGETRALEALRAAAIPSGRAVFLRQHELGGLGKAVLCVKDVVGDAPFAVILPDNVFLAKRPVLAQMAERHKQTGGVLIAGIEVRRESVSNYGIMKIDDTGGDLVAVTDLDEKPEGDTVASNFAISGRYILCPQIFDALSSVAPDARGRVQLTDGIRALIGRTAVNALRFEGERFDCGNISGYVRATIAFAMEEPSLAPEITVYMKRLLQRQKTE